MKNIIFAIVLMMLLSCETQTQKHKKTDPDCAPYFQFDKVEHYFINIDEDDVTSLQFKEHKSPTESNKLDLLNGELPDKLTDTSIFLQIGKLGYKKKIISADKFEKLNQIFCKGKQRDISPKTCIPVYRDILIFKKSNRTVGFAKICFECSQSFIVDKGLNVNDLAQSSDYRELSRLLD